MKKYLILLLTLSLLLFGCASNSGEGETFHAPSNKSITNTQTLPDRIITGELMTIDTSMFSGKDISTLFFDSQDEIIVLTQSLVKWNMDDYIENHAWTYEFSYAYSNVYNLVLINPSIYYNTK